MNVTSRRRMLVRAGVCAGAWTLALPSLEAHALDRPKGKVVLAISGRIGQRNAGDVAQFDMDMMAALPQYTFMTRTPWYSAARKFTGPLLRDVLASVDARGRTLRAVAINDYRVDLPMDDVQRFNVVVARLIDDKPMTVREKGPLFIIYPFDADEVLRTERYYSRSAWQLKTIEVIE